MKLLIVLIATGLLANCPFVYSGPLDETRYCGPPERLANGNIKRRSDVLTAFKRAHPCPVNGQTSGSCPGWQIDHIIPLVCWGCDAVSNLQWLPVEIKSAAGSLPKDRWERRVYCLPPA